MEGGKLYVLGLSSIITVYFLTLHHPHIFHLFPDIRIPQILLDLPHVVLPKLLPCILSAHTRRHNDILTRIPIDRGRNALLIRELQSINYSQHLTRIAARRSRVGHSQADLLGRVDYEDRANGKRDTTVLGEAVKVVLRNHIVQEGNMAVGISDDGEGHLGVADFVDVFDPFVVRGEVVGALRHVSAISPGIWT